MCLLSLQKGLLLLVQTAPVLAQTASGASGAKCSVPSFYLQWYLYSSELYKKLLLYCCWWIKRKHVLYYFTCVFVQYTRKCINDKMIIYKHLCTNWHLDDLSVFTRVYLFISICFFVSKMGLFQMITYYNNKCHGND